LIGAIAGLVCYWGATGLKRMLNADDSLDVFGVHGIGGIVGSLMTGLLASKSISGVEGNVLTQLIGIAAVMVYSAFMSCVLLWLIHSFINIRVGESAEREGLDITEHFERIGT
jgi:ammonium transporter, Amt family